MRIRPTWRDLLGWKAVTGQDIPGNEASPPSENPSRTQMPNRYESLDKFSGSPIYGTDSDDFSTEEDDDENAIPDDVDHAAFVNSQLDSTQECPSTLDVNRFVAQSRKK